MELVLIRHTTPENTQGVAYGQLDVNVGPSFREEAAQVAAGIGKKPYTLVYSSPLIRCRALAEYLADYQGGRTVVRYDDRLKELNFGDWEGKPWADIPPDVLENWVNNFTYLAAPNGENFLAVQERARAFLHDIENCGADRVLVVTHKGVILAVKSLLNNTALIDAFAHRLNFGDVLRFPNYLATLV